MREKKERSFPSPNATREGGWLGLSETEIFARGGCRSLRKGFKLTIFLRICSGRNPPPGRDKEGKEKERERGPH